MKIKLIDFGAAERGSLPTRKHYNDAGADVYAPGSAILHPGQTCKMPLGFGVEIPDGHVGFVFPRSGLSSKGLDCLLPPIDSGYRGEIHAVLANVGDQDIYICTGERIGQLVVLPCIIPDFVEELGEERSDHGFGSSGK